MTVKQSINRLVEIDIAADTLGTAVNFETIAASRTDAKPAPATDPSINGGSGLAAPLTMTVTATQIVNIPVPVGASSVDVEVVTAYDLTDADSNVFPVTVVGYP